MKEKNLIEKLEKTSIIPEIEISSHKRKLREILLSKYPREKRNWVVFNIFQKTIPIGIAIVLIFFTINNLIYPSYTLAKAKEIALKDPQVKELIEKGAVIKDVKIVKDHAYVLIQSAESKTKEEPAIPKLESLGSPRVVEEIKKEEMQVALAEVDIKEWKVAKIEKIVPPVIPLTEEEKEKIQEITQNDPKIQKNIPKEAKIKEVITPPPQLKLIKKGDSVQVLPEPKGKKEAVVIYQFEKSRWQGKINLSEEKVEEIEFLGEFENNATFEK
jgi:hypothetical protein